MAKHVRPAAHWQRKDDPVRRIAAAGHPALKAAMLAVLRKLSELVPDDAVRHARAGDWWGLVRAIDWNHFRQIMRAPYGEIGRIRGTAARLGAQQINAAHARAGRSVRYRKADRTPGTGAGDEFAYDLYDDDIQEQLQQAQDQLIAEMEQGIRDAIKQIVDNGIRLGLSPDETVDDIRALIGLTPRQTQAVQNYRSMLENLDSDALARQLRNSDDDAAVQAALDSGQPLDDAMVDRLVQDYTDNTLDYRADMIAQTEATRAANYGLQDAYEQAIARGVYPAEAVRQHWKIALDESTCQICKSIPDRNPGGIPMGEDFDSSDGPQDSPPVHPNCRCSIEIVTDLDQVDTSDTEAA
jgi:hypothetical protein